jgi:hypothetical protein
MDRHGTAEKAEALATWRSAITVNALVATSAALAPSTGILNLQGVERPFAIARTATMVLALGAIGVLIPQRNNPRTSVAQALFVLPAIPTLLMNWFLAGDRAAQGLPTELFVREAIASAILALATPPRVIVSLVPIAAFSVETLLVYWTARGSDHGQLPPWQPWTSLREVATIVKLEQAAALRRLMRSYLAVRDLVNTPLQTLRVSAHLLGVRYPEAKDVTGTMERAVDRLGDLNQLLADETSTMDSPPGGEAFDPIAVLRASHSKPES